MLQNEALCYFRTVCGARTRPNEGDFQWLSGVSMLDITVSAQEEGVGGGSPLLVLSTGTAARMTQLVYNDWLIFHSHHDWIQRSRQELRLKEKCRIKLHLMNYKHLDSGDSLKQINKENPEQDENLPPAKCRSNQPFPGAVPEGWVYIMWYQLVSSWLFWIKSDLQQTKAEQVKFWFQPAGQTGQRANFPLCYDRIFPNYTMPVFSSLSQSTERSAELLAVIIQRLTNMIW